MTSRVVRTIYLCALLGSVFTLGGCNLIAGLVYLFAPPERPKTVEAEFKDLPGKSVAVVIYADAGIQYLYPAAKMELGTMIASEMRKNIKDVTVIDPLKVVRYQKENIYWDSMDRTQLGKVFGADYVLQVTLVEYATREPGSIGIYKGTIISEASLYQTCLQESVACVWRNGDIRVVYPPEGIGKSSDNDAEISYNMQRLFAETMVQKFYKHKVPVKE